MKSDGRRGLLVFLILVFKQRERLIDANGLDKGVGHREEVAD